MIWEPTALAEDKKKNKNLTSAAQIKVLSVLS